MNSKERAKLRGMANGLDSVFQIGKTGINDQLIRQVDETLEKRELIKITVLESAPINAKEAASNVADATLSEVVQVIGRKFILYRKSKEKKESAKAVKITKNKKIAKSARTGKPINSKIAGSLKGNKNKIGSFKNKENSFGSNGLRGKNNIRNANGKKGLSGTRNSNSARSGSVYKNKQRKY